MLILGECQISFSSCIKKNSQKTAGIFTVTGQGYLSVVSFGDEVHVFAIGLPSQDRFEVIANASGFLCVIG